MKPILPKSSVTGVGYPQIHSIVASPGTTIILATTMAPTNFANFAIGTQGAAQPSPIILPSPSTPTITLSTHNVPQPTPVILPLTSTKLGTSRNLHSRCPPLLAPKNILPRSELVSQQRSVKSVKGRNSNSPKHTCNVKEKKITQNVQQKASLDRDAKKSADQDFSVKSILPKAPRRDPQTFIIVPVPATTQKSSVVSSLILAPNSSAAVDVGTRLDHSRNIMRKKKTENTVAKENKKNLSLKLKHEIEVSHDAKLTCKVNSDSEDSVKIKFARQTKNKSKPMPLTVSKNYHAKLDETDRDTQCKQSDKLPVVPHENMPPVPSRKASPHLLGQLSPQHSVPHHPPPPYPQYSNIKESDLNLHRADLPHGCETGKTERKIQYSKTSNQKLSEVTKKLNERKCKKGQRVSECPASIPGQIASPEKLTNATCASNKVPVDGLQATLPCLSSQSSQSISSVASYPPYTSSTISKLDSSQKSLHSNTIAGTSSCSSIVSPIYSPSSSLLKLHSKDPPTYIIPSSFHATNSSTIEGALDSPFSCVKNHSYSSIYSFPCSHSSADSSSNPLPSWCSASSGFMHSSPSTCQSQYSGHASAASPVLSSALANTCVVTPGSQSCHQASYSHHTKPTHHALSAETPRLAQSSQPSSTSPPTLSSPCISHSYTAFYSQASQPNQYNKVPQKSLHTHPLCSASQLHSSHPVSYTRSHQSFQQASYTQSSQSPSYMHSTRPTLCGQSPQPTSYSPSRLIPHIRSIKSTSHMQSSQDGSHTQPLHLFSCTHSPQPTSYTQSPQPASYTQSPQPTSYTQSPQPTSYTQSPQPTSYTESPQPTSYTESPQPTSYTQSSRPPCIQSPQPIYTKSPQSTLYTQSPQLASYNQSSQRLSHTQALQPTSHTQSTQSVVYTQSAQQTCYAQSPQSKSYRQPCGLASNTESPHPVSYIATHHSVSYAQSPQPSIYSYSPQSASFVQSRHPNSFTTSEHPTTCSQSPQPQGYSLQTQHVNDTDSPSPQALSFVSGHIPSYCQSPQQESCSQSPHATQIPIKASSTNTDDSRLSHLPPFSIPQISPAFHHHASPASISYNNGYNSHQSSDTNYSQYYGSNKGMPLASSSYSTDEINSSFVSMEKSLSPPSYEAHLQNTASFPTSSPHTSGTHHMSITHQQTAPTNYSLSSHSTRLEEEDSPIHSDTGKSVRSPPAYPSSPALLPPPSYTPYSQETPAPNLSDHAIVSDMSKGSYGFSPEESPHAFFQNSQPMLQPPVASPHIDARPGVLLPNCQDYNTSHYHSSASASAFPNTIYHTLHDIQRSCDNEVEFQEQHNRTHKSADQQTLFKHNNQETDLSLAEWRNSKRGVVIPSSESLKVHSLIERAERLWFIPQHEQNRVYMKRKEMARDFLNHPDLHLSRDMMLKEKFWIEEDEPIAEEILLSSLTSNTEEEQQQLEQLKEEVNVSEYSAAVEGGPDYEAAGDRPNPKKKHTREMLCQVCGKMLKGRSSLKSHLNSHHRIQPHACPYCPKSFTNRSVLVAHLRIHTGEMPYVCRICDTSFRTQSGLTRHKSLHTNVRPYECSMCSKAFKTKLVLQQHLKLHLTGLFTCSECGKTFERHKSLAVHKACHYHKSRRFPCLHCHKAYKFRSLLNIHMQVHSNIRKHVCSVCNESFVWRSGLAAHLKIHSTSRPKCDICGMHFASEKRLSTHYRRHSNPQPHRCEVCGRNFSHAYRLVSHSLVHQEHKEYTCPKCGIVFTSAKKIRKHLVSHRKEVPRICQLSGTIEIPKSTT